MENVIAFRRPGTPAGPSSASDDYAEILRQCSVAIDRLQLAAVRLAAIAEHGNVPRPDAFIDEVQSIILMLAQFDPLDPGSRKISGDLLHRIQDLKHRILSWRPSRQA